MCGGRRCYLGPQALASLTEAISSMAAVETLAVGANPFGTEGGNILIEAIQSSNLKTIDIGKPLPLQGKYESDTADLADSGMGPGQCVILAWWLTTDAAAVVASLKLGGADFGVVYTIGASVFQANAAGSGVALRNSPDMDDRWEGGRGPEAGEMVFASEQTDAWIRVANMGEDKWLPKKLLVEVDTTKPSTFQVLCNALKTSQVTEVDFSACGLTSPAMEILSVYVREATAAMTKLDLRKNPGVQMDGEALAVLREAAPARCTILADEAK